MKKKAAFLVFVLFLAASVLPCFAAPPPTDPPATPPKTKTPNLIGTWQGTAQVVREAGYSTFEMTLKITDQKSDVFRGYVTDAQGGWHFLAGYHSVNVGLVLVSQGHVWMAEMWWEGPVAAIGFSAVHDDDSSITCGALRKTTR